MPVALQRNENRKSGASSDAVQRAKCLQANTATLSVAVIALNEAHQLRELVASLAFADEIVLIDGGSHDGTALLAQQLGCRVVQHAFDDFAAQRNRAIDQCRGNWILSIDADERPTPLLAAEIRECIERHAECQAYRVPIRSRIFGRRFRFSGTQDDLPIRLFERRSARWLGDVHERLMVNGRVGRLRGCLEHTTLPDLPSFLRKMDRYTTLEASARHQAGRRPRWRDRWMAPLIEFGRRFLWKGGMLDGPEGWVFCLLSGFSKWVEADKHRRLAHALQNVSSISTPEEKSEPFARFAHRYPESLLPLLVEANPNK